MTKEQPKGIDALQAKQDKEFWKKLEGCCFMEGEFTDMEEVIHINSSIDKMCVESHISKIRQETLQAVREESEQTIKDFELFWGLAPVGTPKGDKLKEIQDWLRRHLLKSLDI